MGEDNFYQNADNVSSANNYIQQAFLNTLDDGTYFTISDSTISALDIIPKLKPDGLPDQGPGSGFISSRSNTTLFAVLNRCRTTCGQKLLAMWLRNPLKSKEKIDTRLTIINQFVNNTQLRTLCYDEYLRKIPDLMRIAFKMSKAKCSLNDLIKVYNTILLTRDLCLNQKKILEQGDGKIPDSVQSLFDWLQTSCQQLDPFMVMIKDNIDVDEPDESGEYMVRPERDESIAKISLEVNSIHERARRLLKSVAEDLNLEADKSVKLEVDPTKGFGLRVTKQNEQSVRKNDTYQQLATVKKDGYRFTTDRLDRLSDKYKNVKQEYNEATKFIMEEILSDASQYESQVLELGMGITILDLFVSLATVSHQSNFNIPLIQESSCGKIEFDRLRHPCVECQPDVENYVPNDIIMDRSNKTFYLITGPNMGGKSTFIKSVAVGVIMAQCGCFVPADDARVSIVDGIYTRIGAGDKQMEGISTFMEEMMDIATIMKESNENSLVIIDELGRGTSTFDGFGIAWAISKKLASETKSYCLFATHFIELTELSKELPKVGNLHVKALCRDGKLTMLYDINEGICDESYGINVAEYTKFPARVVELAKERLKQFEEVAGFATKQEVRDFVKECQLGMANRTG